MRIAATEIVATVPPPGIEPELEVPYWSRRIDPRWLADMIAQEINCLLTHPGCLIDGLRFNGEVVEDEATAYELQWVAVSGLLPPKATTGYLQGYNQKLVRPSATALAGFFLEQCALKKVVTTKLAPAKHFRSACSLHPYIRVRVTVAHVTQPKEGTLMVVDGLFGSQMLGTPESARRLMSNVEAVPRSYALPITPLPEGEQPLSSAPNCHWDRQTLVTRQN